MVPHPWIAWLIFSWLGFLTFACVWLLVDRRGKRKAIAAGQVAVAALQAQLAEQDEQIGNLTRTLARLGPADAQPALPRSAVLPTPPPPSAVPPNRAPPLPPPPLVPTDETVEVAPVTQPATRPGEDGRRTSSAPPPPVRVVGGPDRDPDEG